MTTKNGQATSEKRAPILIVDDHPMTRYGIARLLEQEPDLIVCGEAENASRALAAVRTLRPQVVLADLTMPGGEGLEFIKDLRALHPEVAVLVVSMHDEALYAERALRAGARGYIMKNEGGEKLVKAIRQVLGGKTYVSENMSGKVLEIFSGHRRRADDTTIGKLTDREFEVFRLLGQGLTTREIGQRLHLGAKTVETHRLHVRQKLGLESGPALIKYAVHWAGTQELI
ncbi:MAG: response regulator transcription factor [Verrucomicrobiota bacterium]|jgi:DNA-binding NarL/FixJ family response regulator